MYTKLSFENYKEIT